MFLNQLNQREKEAFISLSIHAGKANGVLEENEIVMVREYCQEMELPMYDDKDIAPLSDVYGVFKSSDERIKKIVLLEVLGLIYADGNYDDDEKSFVADFAEAISLSEQTVEDLTIVIKDYLDVLKRIGELIF